MLRRPKSTLRANRSACIVCAAGTNSRRPGASRSPDATQSVFRLGRTGHPGQRDVTKVEQHRASARESLHTRRAFDLERLCRGDAGVTLSGEAWLAEVLGAVSAR